MIRAEPLTAKAYSSFGQVVEFSSSEEAIEANQGSASRRNWLGKLMNLREEKAKPNMCVFRCSPRSMPFDVKLLERHEYSTQCFIPMNATRYLVVVAEGDKDRPDMSTLRVFQAREKQAITYNPGVWHHPMIALDRTTDFVCLVWEDGSTKDTDVVVLNKSEHKMISPSASL